MTHAAAELAYWEGQSVQHWARAWAVPVLRIFARTTSTNDDAKRLADLGAPSGTTVIAEEQTAGKGRFGRRWTAPPGQALLISYVLRPAPPHRTIRVPTSIPIRAGIAVARAIESVARIEPRLKWPNDVVIPSAANVAGKVAGILCEGASGAGAAEYVIAGIGINVNQRETELPDGIRATSLAIATRHEVRRDKLAGALLAELARLTTVAGEPLDGDTLDEYARRDLLLGARIVISDRIHGTAAGITADGALRIDGRDGLKTIRSGTVRLAAEP